MGSAQLAAAAVQASNIAPGAVDNTKLANAGVTVSAGAGLAGGGAVALGGTVMLSNGGVLSLQGGGGVTVSDVTGNITLGSNADSASTPGSLVMRDASGNFSAGTITGNLLGSAALATTALSALSSSNFTGQLLGDVTGVQGATQVAAVGGATAASLAAAATASAAATAAATPGTLVMRDAGGSFAGATVTAVEFAGDGAGLTGVPGTLPWQSVSGTAQQAAANTGYLASDPGLVTVTLPVTASPGDIVRVSGVGLGGWAIVPNAGQSITGFAAGAGPAGSQGATGTVQCIGPAAWQPLQESHPADGAITSAKIAPGAVGSAQLAPSLTLSGTISAANFTGGGQGLTGLSASNLSTGTLPKSVLSNDVALLDGTNSWTGSQTFSNLTLASASPGILLLNTGTSASFGLGLTTDAADPAHDFFLIGLNLYATPDGNVIVNASQDAWGLSFELDYYNGNTVRNEAYFTDGGGGRPFAISYAQGQVADVVSINSGVVTITNISADVFLKPGLWFQFTDLNGNSGVQPNTFYSVKTVLSPTTFTFAPQDGGDAINATATGGIMKRGGYGSALFTVPLGINVLSYAEQSTAGGATLFVTNSVSNHPTLISFHNETGSQAVVEFNKKWRMGNDLQGRGLANNFYLMDMANDNSIAIQVDSSDRMAVGFPLQQHYVPHSNSATLDVNGGIFLADQATPSNPGSLPPPVKNEFIVFNGVPYFSDGDHWYALTLGPPQ